MIHQLLQKLDRMAGLPEASAHCDIPCGIYDPIVAQISALTVIRMVDLMNDLIKDESVSKLEFHNKMGRYITVKEEHAQQCEREIRIIWGDYMKAAHIEKHPELHSLVHKIMGLASKAKQTVSREAAVELLEAINRFAEIFWETKGKAIKRAKAPYAPAEEVVYPVL